VVRRLVQPSPNGLGGLKGTPAWLAASTARAHVLGGKGEFEVLLRRSRLVRSAGTPSATREVVSILIDESERHGEERRGILRVVAQTFLRGGGVQAIAFRRDDHAEQPDVTRRRQPGDLIV
jgi:hypothetical protein